MIIPGNIHPNAELQKVLAARYWLPAIRTQKEVLDWLNAEVAKIMQMPSVADSLKSQTFEISTGTPEAMAKALRDEAAVNAKIVAEAKIKPE